MIRSIDRGENIFIDWSCTMLVPYSWSTNGTIEPKPVELEVSHYAGSGIFRGIVTFAPLVMFNKNQRKITVDLGSSRVAMKELEHKKPGGLAIVSWEIEMMYAGYPDQTIQNVQCEFDAPDVGVGNSGSVFDIPANATKLSKVKLNFKWIGSVHEISFDIDAPLETNDIKKKVISYSVKIPTGYAILP